MALTLSARQIRKSYGGVEVLHGVDLDVAGGEVLALLGENGAGKSTLVKIVAGDQPPDSGTLLVDGDEQRGLTPRLARSLGIAIISQEFQDAPTLSVAENIALGRLPNRGGLVSWREVNARAEKILGQLEVDVDPDRPVGDLSVGERQIVEIARALTASARLLILDEPTAALSAHETEVLFAFIRRLRVQGTALIYITHRLDEVAEIATRVQVLRDGSTALEAEVAATDRRALVEAMIGRSSGAIGRPAPGEHTPGDTPAIRWVDATGRGFRDVTLHVRPGEVVALYGKLGSGAAEVAQTAYGLGRLESGALEIAGQPATVSGSADAIRRGIGFLPADRKAGGAFLIRSVAENVAVASWPVLSVAGLITRARETAAYRRWHDRLSIRSRNDPRQVMGTLSGGNQQKVLLARWLERRARVLVLLEPTRGVDVGARSEIYAVLRQLAAEGVAVLIVTSDYEEAVQVADRSYVMARGRVVRELTGDDIRTDSLVEASGG